MSDYSGDGSGEAKERLLKAIGMMPPDSWIPVLRGATGATVLREPAEETR